MSWKQRTKNIQQRGPRWVKNKVSKSHERNQTNSWVLCKFTQSKRSKAQNRNDSKLRVIVVFTVQTQLLFIKYLSLFGAALQPCTYQKCVCVVVKRNSSYSYGTIYNAVLTFYFISAQPYIFIIYIINIYVYVCVCLYTVTNYQEKQIFLVILHLK